MSQAMQCKYFNSTDFNMAVTLAPKEWVAITYGCNLRMGDPEGREFFHVRSGVDSCVISAAGDGLLKLHLAHGRTDPEQDMDEFGTAYSGDPLIAEIVHFTPEGIHLITTDPKCNTPVIKTLKYHQDMIEYEGVYYGDPSVEGL